MIITLNPYELENVEQVRESLFMSKEVEDSKNLSKNMQEDYDLLELFLNDKEEKTFEQVVKYCSIMKKYKNVFC